MRRTRSFARRQASWFRRDPRIVWTDPAVGPAQLLDQALGAYQPPAPGAHDVAGPELRDCGGALHETRRGGQRLHRCPRSRRHPRAFGGPGPPALRPAPGHRGRRDHPGRPGSRRLRPLHGAAQRRRGRGRDERQRHPLPGPGRGRRRAGDAAPLSRWPRRAASARSTSWPARRPAGPAPAWTWARCGSGPISPRTSRTVGPARWTWATRISSCSAPRWRASTSRCSAPSCSPPSPEGSTWSGSA